MEQIKTVVQTSLEEALSPRTITARSGWSPDFEVRDPTTANLIEQAKAFEAECASGLPGRWLTISGDAGTGKTFLARQLFDQCTRYNPGNAAIWTGPGPRPISVFMAATQFASMMKSGSWYLPEELKAEFLVCIDDIGAVYDRTEFVTEALYRLLNARLGKWTIFTTNLSAEEIGRTLDSRIISRMIRDLNRFTRLKVRDYALR